MGKESWAPKERVCKHCGGVLYCDAERLKGHAALCKRAAEIGIVMPGLVVP